MAPRKSKKKSKTVKLVVDTEQYIVEKIVGNSIENNTIHYLTKWAGYSSEWDTEEAEWRMNCDEKLLDFAISAILTEQYIDKLPELLGDLESLYTDNDLVLKLFDPLSIFAQTTVQCGSVKYVHSDTLESKKMFLQYIRDTHQQYLLNAALVPSEEEIDEDSHRYKHELLSRLACFPEHPNIRISFPITSDRLFYPPPPLSTILFEPVTLSMMEQKSKYEHLFVVGSKDLGFNKTCPFVRPSCLRKPEIELDPRYYEHFEQNKKKKLFDGMSRKDYKKDPRFGISLELVQELGRGWILKVGQDVEIDTPLIMMTGVISPVQVAHQSLVRQGERIAFSSFIEIPRSPWCLDRREYHDFTKYIPHSCKPTCSVRLVKSGNEHPDLVVFSLVPLTDYNNHIISLDYFQAFTKDVNEYFLLNKPVDGKIFTLYEKKVDFVQCLCDHDSCREVLYIDKSTKRDESTARKTEKLASLDPNFEYRGMSLVEPRPEKVWEIHNGLLIED